MPRRGVLLQSIYPYGISARSNNKEWFDLPLSICWNIFTEVIEKTSERYGVRTHCFVLMSNHFHWLVSTPDSNLGEAMRYFMTETSRRIARASGRINKIYGSRYKWTFISEASYYANTIRYFYQNPLRAKICNDVDSYLWSTRSADSKIKLTPDPKLETSIPSDPDELKRWLNRIPDGPYQLMMQKALRRSEFRFPPHPTTKRPLNELSFLD